MIFRVLVIVFFWIFANDYAAKNGRRWLMCYSVFFRRSAIALIVSDQFGCLCFGLERLHSIWNDLRLFDD